MLGSKNSPGSSSIWGYFHSSEKAFSALSNDRSSNRTKELMKTEYLIGRSHTDQTPEVLFTEFSEHNTGLSVDLPLCWHISRRTKLKKSVQQCNIHTIEPGQIMPSRRMQDVANSANEGQLKHNPFFNLLQMNRGSR
jgi:hypothetical protein